MKLVRLIPARKIILALAILIFSLAGSGKTPAAKVAPRASELVDVNHASVEELKTLPGIQDAYAAKIVKNRPYANKTQLSSKGVIPAATYKKIRALIIAKQ